MSAYALFHHRLRTWLDVNFLSLAFGRLKLWTKIQTIISIRIYKTYYFHENSVSLLANQALLIIIIGTYITYSLVFNDVRKINLQEFCLIICPIYLLPIIQNQQYIFRVYSIDSKVN